MTEIHRHYDRDGKFTGETHVSEPIRSDYTPLTWSQRVKRWRESLLRFCFGILWVATWVAVWFVSFVILNIVENTIRGGGSEFSILQLVAPLFVATAIVFWVRRVVLRWLERKGIIEEY